MGCGGAAVKRRQRKSACPRQVPYGVCRTMAEVLTWSKRDRFIAGYRAVSAQLRAGAPLDELAYTYAPLLTGTDSFFEGVRAGIVDALHSTRQARGE